MAYSCNPYRESPTAYPCCSCKLTRAMPLDQPTGQKGEAGYSGRRKRWCADPRRRDDVLVSPMSACVLWLCVCVCGCVPVACAVLLCMSTAAVLLCECAYVCLRLTLLSAA